jgi:hypothetical protein
LRQETDIAVKEQAQVVHAITQHGQAVWAHAADAPELVRAQAAELWQEEDWTPRPRQPVAVECLDTGETYASMTAAARAAFVTPQRMAMVLVSGGTANGRRYRRVT